MTRTHRRPAFPAVVVTALLVMSAFAGASAIGPAVAVGSATAASVAPLIAVPRHSAVLTATRSVADYYRTTLAHTTVTPTNGWSWATWAEGMLSLYRQVGDERYFTDAMGWGQANSWQVATATQLNPDSIKAGQTYFGLNAMDPTASLGAMDAQMAQDLTHLPVSQYDWGDASFMGLADWSLWAKRTGNAAYLNKLDALYAWARDQGATSSRCAGKVVAPQNGLFSATQKLWYRDCTYVGTNDPNGKPIFWSRGNGWVVAAMADVLQALPSGDARAADFATMLTTMAARLIQLQGSDGFWRSSLLDSALYPQPETSGTALITYALAYGINAGILDRATYLPAVVRAWTGLSKIAVQPSGFVTDCQAVGGEPAASYPAPAPRTAPTPTSSGTVNADSPPFCVGAVLLAGSAVAQLSASPSTGAPVTFTGQSAGSEARYVNDGDVTTRWAASGFPQSVTIDLGTNRELSNSMVVTYLDRAFRYRIETSTNNTTWQVVVDRTSNTATGTHLDDFTPGVVNARYVRLTVTGVYGVVTTLVKIQEFAVYSEPVYAADTFTRTTTSGLGSADTGGAWTLCGSPSAFSVGGKGNLRLATAGSGLSAYLNSVSARDVDLTVDASVSRAPLGGVAYVAAAARHATGNEYRVKLRWPPAGAASVYLTKVVGGTETNLVRLDVAGLVPTATDTVRIRFRVSGSAPTTLNMKVWKKGAAEPPAWTATAADSTTQLQGAGGVGLWADLSPTSTNAPITASFDDLTVEPPA